MYTIYAIFITKLQNYFHVVTAEVLYVSKVGYVEKTPDVLVHVCNGDIPSGDISRYSRK